MAFFQLFTVMPLYYNEIFQLGESKISILITLNVVIIVIFEMPLLNYLEKQMIPITKHILMSCILLAISFLVLYQNFWIGILIINMVLMTLSEMLGFPYTNKFALGRAKEGLEGSYMSMYAMSFSLAHIFSPKIGLTVVDLYGYQINWLITLGYGLLAIILAFWLHKRIKQHL
jgi:predicted MFS family arabinose efflux permease